MGETTKNVKKELKQLSESYRSYLETVSDDHELRRKRTELIGSRGVLTLLMKEIPHLDVDERKTVGKQANSLKREISDHVSDLLNRLDIRKHASSSKQLFVDMTLPSRMRRAGKLHPITRVKHDLLDILVSLGFEIADGPEVDTYERCFDKLAFPPNHPATDMHDTFFIDVEKENLNDTMLLRTHTSTVQIREMMKRKPPFAIVSAGMVFRRDDDSTHSPIFHQLEGFLVDRVVTFSNLRGMIELIIKRMIGSDYEFRFRPSYFPFVEPGVEVDIRALGSSWMEVLGCGMIHPEVLRRVQCDPDFSGFAFGIGIDRLAMIKYGIDNIKLLTENDVRFLRSF